jgi:hypothetical protein
MNHKIMVLVGLVCMASGPAYAGKVWGGGKADSEEKACRLAKMEARGIIEDNPSRRFESFSECYCEESLRTEGVWVCSVDAYYRE